MKIVNKRYDLTRTGTENFYYQLCGRWPKRDMSGYMREVLMARILELRYGTAVCKYFGFGQAPWKTIGRRWLAVLCQRFGLHVVDFTDETQKAMEDGLYEIQQDECLMTLVKVAFDANFSSGEEMLRYCEILEQENRGLRKQKERIADDYRQLQIKFDQAVNNAVLEREYRRRCEEKLS